MKLIGLTEQPKSMWCVIEHDAGINREQTVRFSHCGLIENDMELLYLLGFEITDEVEETDSNLINNYYEANTIDELEEFGIVSIRKATDEEIKQAIFDMPDAIAAYQEQDLESAYKANGIEHLLTARELKGVSDAESK